MFYSSISNVLGQNLSNIKHVKQYKSLTHCCKQSVTKIDTVFLNTIDLW